MAASTASAGMPIPPQSGFALKQRSPSMEKKHMKQVGIANGRSSPQHKQQMNPFAQQQQQQQSSTSSFQAQQSPYQASAQTVTALGAVKKIAPRKPKQEDDIFASMGLSAQPKFETNRPAAVRSTPPSSGGASSAWGALAAVPATASSSLAVPAATASNSDAWDDGDLDDLLDD
jgi:hypothetical protein